MNREYPSQRLLLVATAPSTDPSLPAFFSRPRRAPAYHGFPVVKESETDGWYFGAITEFEVEDGCEYGDGFVIAPDATRAGIVWDVGEGDIQVVSPPDESRWGVYAVCFPRVVRTINDLVFNFRHVLPDLKKKFLEVNSQS